jgi:hypothetical protein
VNETGHHLTRAERVAEMKKSKPAAPTPCVQERITMTANGAGAVHRCLSDGVWWIYVWTKSASGWQALAVQGTPAAK